MRKWLLGASLISFAACGETTRKHDQVFDAEVPQDMAALQEDMSSSLPDMSADGTVPFMPLPVNAMCETADCQIAWDEQPSYPTRADHHTSFIVEAVNGPRLMVVGGIVATSSGGIASHNTIVHSAAIQSDGSIGPWEVEGDLNYSPSFHAYVGNATDAYLMGGIVLYEGEEAGFPYTYHVKFDDDGHATAFDICDAEFTHPVTHATAVMFNDKVVLIGGSGDGNAFSNEVVIGAKNGAGCIDTWVPSVALPQDRSHHIAIVHEGKIYIAGGLGGTHTSSVERNDILRSTLDGDGNITGWETVGTISPAPWTASAFERDGQLWLIGGAVNTTGGGGHSIDTVQRAPFNGDGTVGTFVTLADPLPRARAHVHQAPVYGNHVYSIGGRVILESGLMETVDDVYVGTFK